MINKKTKRNKYGATRATYNDIKYDSKFEAFIAYEIDMLIRAGKVKAVERQYKINMQAFSQCKTQSLKMSHRVDFRIEKNDGDFVLLEAKGVETADYKWRVKWLKAFYLPFNQNHDYIVVYPKTRHGEWVKAVC